VLGLNAPLVTLILVIITISIGMVAFSFMSSQGFLFESQSNILQQAEYYSSELQISSSQPVCKPTGNSNSISINYLITFNIPGYSGKIILFPFLVPANQGSLAYYNPGNVEYVENPNYVGYFSISPSTPIEMNNLVLFSNNQGFKVSGTAYVIKNDKNVTITVTTNSLLEPVIWVIVDISGNLYRISYPILPNPAVLTMYNTQSPTTTSPPPTIPIYTQEGKVTFPIEYITYYKYLQQLFGDYSQIYYLNGNCAKFHGNQVINASNSNIGFVSSQSSTVMFNGNVQVIANYLGYSPDVTINEHGHVSLPPKGTSNLPPYIPLSEIASPILSSISNVNFEENPSPCISFTNYKITNPTIFQGSVTFNGNSNVMFDAPVIFEGPVTFNGNSNVTFCNTVIFENSVKFNGNSNIQSKAGMIFNGKSSIVTFIGNTQNTLGGAIIFNTSQVIFNGNSNVLVKGPVALASSVIFFNGNSNLTTYQYAIFYNSPKFTGNAYIGTLNKIPPINTKITVPESLLYTTPGSSDTFSAWFETIPNNYSMWVFQYIINNTAYTTKLQGIIWPKSFNCFELTFVDNNNTGCYNLGSVPLSPYSWYYMNITVIYPKMVQINLYSTSSENPIFSKTFYTVLPVTSEFSLCIGNESFTQLFFDSSPSVSSTPNLMYANGPLSNNTNEVSGMQWGNQIVLYYYLVSSNGYSNVNYVYPSFAYPSSYSDYKLVLQQRIVGFYS